MKPGIATSLFFLLLASFCIAEGDDLQIPNLPDKELDALPKPIEIDTKTTDTSSDDSLVRFKH